MPPQTAWAYHMRLVVTVHRARGIAAADSNGFSDPYTSMRLGKPPPSGHYGRAPKIMRTYNKCSPMHTGKEKLLKIH